MNLFQGTPEWHLWRKQGVGASEVPVLMGESDFTTPREIWKQKLGLAEPQGETSWAQQRGIDAEPRIRALYELIYGFDVPPATVEHWEHPYLRASLDGWDPERRLIVEIKYTGREKHEQAVKNEVPLCYRAQIQYQLAVTGAKEAHYVSYDGARIAVVEVSRDEEYITRMLAVVKEFWERVLNNEAPPLTDNDFVTLDGPADVELFKAWRDAKTANDKKRMEQLRPELIARVPHPKVLCAGVQVLRVKRKTGDTWDIRLKESA